MVYIPFTVCPNDRNSLIKYLYDNKYDMIMQVNENQCLTYFKNKSNGKLYISSDLCAGFHVWCVDDNSCADVEIKELYKQPFEKFDVTQKLSYNLFKNIFDYLCEWYGEYGDYILKIKVDEKGERWVICARVEKPWVYPDCDY